MLPIDAQPFALKLLVAALLCAPLLVIVGCGDSEPKPPSAVTAADLEKNGDFWVSLTPDLKDELVDLGKSKLGEERPSGASGIQAFSTDKLVAEIEKEYANESKRESTIYETYTGANDKLAKAGLDSTIDELQQLCSSEPAPPRCNSSP